MLSLKQQFSFQQLPHHFEKDTHIDIQGLDIERVRVLAGESPAEDLLVVIYKGSPNLSFYNTEGQLIDIDHYLPDNYQREDVQGADSLIANLRDIDKTKAQSKSDFGVILQAILQAGGGELGRGLRNKFGLETQKNIVQQFKAHCDFADDDKRSFKEQLQSKFKHLEEFLEAFIIFQQKVKNGYVHFTAADNIVISSLNKRSGIAVLIETQNVHGQLLPPNQWIITRTHNEKDLQEALVFRSTDIRLFFEASGTDEIYETSRYKLFHSPEQVSIDSLIDNTNNLLKLPAVNNCFQILPSDPNIIIVLTNEQEVTIVNTHRSIVPHKWPKKVVLPEAATWVRADENLHTLFLQKEDGEIIVVDISGDHPTEIERLGTYDFRFELDQTGSLIVKPLESNELIKISTNVNELEVQTDQKTFASVLKNLSHLFKGESLFTQTQFAQLVEAQKVVEPQQLPSVFDDTRFDFEANVEQLLADAGNSFDKLLGVQSKVAIARQNIAEELTTYAEKAGIFLVGQRLQKAINGILRPSEKKIRHLVEESRAKIILTETNAFHEQIKELDDPNAYRDILNNIRKFETELNGMLPVNSAKVINEFKAIQQELNQVFSQQIASDGTALQTFISGEIEQIETAIQNTHVPRQLETLLSVHPAAIELMSLLKQPFILQNIAKEKKLSPAGIQNRLFKAVEVRKQELRQEIEKKEAEQNAAKVQLAKMIQKSIDFFVLNHSGSFSDLGLTANAAYQQLIGDILKLEELFKDVRLAMEMRRLLSRRILERNQARLEKMVTFEGKYAFIQNDPNLYIDLESSIQQFPTWEMQLLEKKGAVNTYLVTFIRQTDRSVYRPSTTDNLQSGKAFELEASDYQDFADAYQTYVHEEHSYEFLDCLWKISRKQAKGQDFPQFDKGKLKELQPKGPAEQKGLRCALEKKKREHEERTRPRAVPRISPEFIDDTPYFQSKLQEFIIKAKLQLVSGTGIILLSGPPSTGKSAFLKFIAAVMNREYFEHAADKWQTKNSLINAIKFGEQGPYATPAGFTKAITTPYSLINIEEIKEWPEALRKSLNPFFAGSNVFIAPDGTSYHIGDNILLCAAANLGSMYRQDDEPFTADFWSRIEVVEYDYAPEKVNKKYYKKLLNPVDKQLLTIQELVRAYFEFEAAPTGPKEKAAYFSRRFLEFILLPKADEKVKRDNLQNYIHAYFQQIEAGSINEIFSPEEAAKVALRRIADLQGYTAREFFDLYDHFVNGGNLQSKRIARLQTGDIEQYTQLKYIVLSLRYLEGCLRSLREQFHHTAGQTEVEGTNREFIKCVYLLGLIGRF